MCILCYVALVLKKLPVFVKKLKRVREIWLIAIDYNQNQWTHDIIIIS